jgi:hypothetical protein
LSPEIDRVQVLAKLRTLALWCRGKRDRALFLADNETWGQYAQALEDAIKIIGFTTEE